MAVDELFTWIASQGGAVEGITFSGGEPLEQPRALGTLLEKVRHSTRLSVLVSTGYTWEAIMTDPDQRALLPLIDALIAGPYVAAQHLASGYRGSANKTVHLLTARYALEEIERTPAAEAIIINGETVWTGLAAPLGVGRDAAEAPAPER